MGEIGHVTSSQMLQALINQSRHPTVAKLSPFNFPGKIKIDLTKCLVVNLESKKNDDTVKPVLSSHSKIDKTKILMANGSLRMVKSIAECSLWHILQYF